MTPKPAVLLLLAVGATTSVIAVAEESPVDFAQHAKKIVEDHFPDRECRTNEDYTALVCGNVNLGLENLRRKIEEVGAEGSTADAMILQFFGLAMGKAIQREHALANLAAASSHLKVEAQAPQDSDLPGHWLAIAERDGYDAARYLVPEIRKHIVELLGETFFVAFPNRDFLVAWSRDFAYHLDFAERVQEDFESRHHPPSPEIYVGSVEGVREATVEDHLTAVHFDWGDD